MRPQATNVSAPPIPAPALPCAARPANAEDLFSRVKGHLAEGGHSYASNHLMSALEALTEDDPDLPRLADELATTGSPRARSIMLNDLNFLMMSVHSALTEANGARDWHEGVAFGSYPHPRNQLASAWHTGSVMDELEAAGAIEDGRADYNLAFNMDGFLRGGECAEDQTGPEAASRWRGLAALRLCGLSATITQTDEDRAKAEAFAQYAGAHESIAEVCTAARDTDSADAKVLEHLIAQRSQTEPALRDGAL